MEVLVADSRAYLTCTYSGIRVIDVSDRTKPTELRIGPWGGKEPPHVSGWSATSLALNQGILYVADRSAGLRVIDILNLRKSEFQVGLFSPLGFAGHVTVTGNYAYVTGTFARSYNVDRFDLSNITQPRDIATSETGGTGRNLEIVENFAYVFVYSAGRIGFEILG